ncbi:cytochrome P460 family protein [Jannaschia sp. W003]|uniref:cytochrome P460 family protein n=1 Tax=Jannaschia sp. W003 TaxID=2867012 RepID=UPI0021A89B9E|nr:cytochrome P460 family protein [Jannaschia sp. W003]UWQ22578.1 cytochrome P460 family protein [Jannaschia sp. W003]
MSRTAATAAVLLLLAAPAGAEGYVVEGDPWELGEAGVSELYGCMEARMAAGYASGGDPAAVAYRGWTAAATRPAVAGPHGERFLLTFANPVAAEQYLRFEEEGFEMPVGSVLAKESIAVGEGGVPRVGPLFLMEKVDGAPETDGWRYSAVMENGAYVDHTQAFCHDCHAAFADRDALGYPLEEVRVAR